MSAYPDQGGGSNGAQANGDGALARALAYLGAGLSAIPIPPDGSKRPQIKWGRFQKELMKEPEARARWRDGRDGIAVVAGAVSGGAELIDLDRGELFDPWRELVEAQAPGLVDRLCRVRTPRQPSGFHVWYRCTEVAIPGNTKLASEPGTDAKTGKTKAVTLIETRGEGGYALVPGSPGACHPTGGTYEHIAGPPLTGLPVITAAEREILIAAARSFDRMSGAKKAPAGGEGTGAGVRPGDDYDRRGPGWAKILEPHGWALAGTRADGASLWRRPGKDGAGISATTGYCKGKDGADLFAVFSSNAHPFDGPTGARPCSCYGKFAAYALLNHGGDFKAAAKDLAAQGYGEQRARRNGHAHDNRPAGRADGEEPPQEVPLGPLRLRPVAAHQTKGGKLSVSFDVLRGGGLVDHLQLSNTANGRKEMAAALRRLLAGDAAALEKVEGALSDLVVAGLSILDGEAEAERPPVLDTVRGAVLVALDLRFRTDKGLWSERQGRELTRADFLAFTPPWLLQMVNPRPDGELEALPTVKDALQALWPEFREQLPDEANADLGPDSAAAAAFRAAVVELWKVTKTWEVANTPGDPTARASLIGRAVSQFQQEAGKAVAPRREGWQRILAHVDAWWRPHRTADGRTVLLLAMHYEVACQVGVRLPGVTDEPSLVTLGRKYGALDPDPPVCVVTGRGTRRLAVLARDLTEFLQATPEAKPGDTQGGGVTEFLGDTPPGVSPKNADDGDPAWWPNPRDT